MGPHAACRRSALALTTAIGLSLTPPSVLGGPDLARVSGYADVVTLLTETRIPVSDDGGHVIIVTRHHSAERWTLAGCETMSVTSVSLSDVAGRTGSSRGYRVATCPDGDTLLFTYEGTLDILRDPSGRPVTMFEGRWQFKGGTGKFRRKTGGGTYNGRTTPDRTVTEWEGEEVLGG